MPTPAEHYTEAERLLDEARRGDWWVEEWASRRNAILAAQVHATLATISPHTHNAPGQVTK